MAAQDAGPSIRLSNAQKQSNLRAKLEELPDKGSYGTLRQLASDHRLALPVWKSNLVRAALAEHTCSDACYDPADAFAVQSYADRMRHARKANRNSKPSATAKQGGKSGEPAATAILTALQSSSNRSVPQPTFRDSYVELRELAAQLQDKAFAAGTTAAAAPGRSASTTIAQARSMLATVVQPHRARAASQPLAQIIVTIRKHSGNSIFEDHELAGFNEEFCARFLRLAYHRTEKKHDRVTVVELMHAVDAECCRVGIPSLPNYTIYQVLQQEFQLRAYAGQFKGIAVRNVAAKTSAPTFTTRTKRSRSEEEPRMHKRPKLKNVSNIPSVSSSSSSSSSPPLSLTDSTPLSVPPFSFSVPPGSSSSSVPTSLSSPFPFPFSVPNSLFSPSSFSSSASFRPFSHLNLPLSALPTAPPSSRTFLKRSVSDDMVGFRKRPRLTASADISDLRITSSETSTAALADAIQDFLDECQKQSQVDRETLHGRINQSLRKHCKVNRQQFLVLACARAKIPMARTESIDKLADRLLDHLLNSPTTLCRGGDPKCMVALPANRIPVATCGSCWASLPPFSRKPNVPSNSNSSDSVTSPFDPVSQTHITSTAIRDLFKGLRRHLDPTTSKPISSDTLPLALQPTAMQNEFPTYHRHINYVLQPSIRDALIRAENAANMKNFDIATCVFRYQAALSLGSHINSLNPFAGENFDLADDWVRDYFALVDRPLLKHLNALRKARGQPRMRFVDGVVVFEQS